MCFLQISDYNKRKIPSLHLVVYNGNFRVYIIYVCCHLILSAARTRRSSAFMARDAIALRMRATAGNAP